MADTPMFHMKEHTGEHSLVETWNVDLFRSIIILAPNLQMPGPLHASQSNHNVLVYYIRREVLDLVAHSAAIAECSHMQPYPGSSSRPSKKMS